MRNNETRNFFTMEKNFFSMMIRFTAGNLTSPVAMEQPITTENYVELFGSTGFTRVYEGNTFRTVAVPPKKNRCCL